ncbi:MAG TPA: hypothetical protein VMA83_00725 [Solirubrobacteraceae bacterium]|nr:hypothetical protein [Solirubrobacteraceae bacterium]
MATATKANSAASDAARKRPATYVFACLSAAERGERDAEPVAAAPAAGESDG